LVTPGHALGFNNWIRKPKNLAVLVAMVLGWSPKWFSIQRKETNHP
jgi:hypothetical protein